MKGGHSCLGGEYVRKLMDVEITPDAPAQWQPPAAIRRWLIAGAAGTLSSMALSACALWFFMGEDLTAEGITTSGVFDLAAGVPLVLALVAMLKLARSLDSIALRRSSMGVFGCTWLLMAMTPLQADHRPAMWEVLIAMCILTGMAILGAAILRRPWYRATPVEGAAPEATSPPEEAGVGKGPVPLQYETPPLEKSGWGSSIVVLLVWIIGRRVLRRTDWGWPLFMLTVTPLLLAGLAASTIAWGIIKIRHRRQLGPWGMLSGYADLGMVAAGAACVGAMVWLSVGAGDEVFPPAARVPIAIGYAVSLLWEGILAGMLISLAQGGSASRSP